MKKDLNNAPPPPSREEGEGIRLKRLRFRSWHRGCKETDLLLGHFADTALPGLNTAALDAFEALLNEDDANIWAWLVGKAEAPKPEYAPLLERLKSALPL